MTPTTWALGDYPRMAAVLEPVASRAVALAEVSPGDRVLDVACGTGNAALVAARLGAAVVGVDFEPALLEIARWRGGDIDYREGDAVALPFADGRFDVVLSVFGVMYAPDHSAAARELVRMARRGGRVVIAAWTPGSLMPAMGGALAPYLPPPPPGSGPPSRWGDEDELAAILDSAGIALESVAQERIPATDLDADFLIATAGHVLAERQRLESEGRWAALGADMRALVERELPLEYLLALARVP